ncbi:hypothetical protein C8Q70DRAFT_936887 [Cubamyces menziesii]|nr:hypothetical protein C8Q70DRAFT_936887 [Cubamyces menziesii]
MANLNETGASSRIRVAGVLPSASIHPQCLGNGQRSCSSDSNIAPSTIPLACSITVDFDEAELNSPATNGAEGNDLYAIPSYGLLLRVEGRLFACSDPSAERGLKDIASSAGMSTSNPMIPESEDREFSSIAARNEKRSGAEGSVDERTKLRIVLVARELHSATRLTVPSGSAHSCLPAPPHEHAADAQLGDVSALLSHRVSDRRRGKSVCKIHGSPFVAKRAATAKTVNSRSVKQPLRLT